MLSSIGYILKAPVTFAKKLAGMPITSVFYSIVSKWYLILASLSVIVLYWVIEGLNKAGVIDDAFASFEDAGQQIKGFAQHCTPLVKDLNLFLKCMLDTPEYTGDAITNALELNITEEVEKFNNRSHPVTHDDLFIITPYDMLSDQEGLNFGPREPSPPPAPKSP